VRFRIGYFDEATVRAAVGGCCHDFALALHRRTGWPVAAVWKDPAGDRFTILFEPTAVHVFCVAPGGLAVDAEGARDIADMARSFCPAHEDVARYRSEVHGDEAAWSEAASRAAEALMPRERGIAAAEAVIAASPAFLSLLAELAVAPSP